MLPLANPISPDNLLSSFGLIGMAVILFAECGLLIGFFLPGDTLLLAAGVSLAVGTISTPLPAFLVVAPIAAIVGNLVGYWIGYKTGKALYSRPNSLLFRREHLLKTHEFYEKHGGKTIIIARFMPIFRTFAPVVAGAAEMTYRRFAIYNVAGGIGWVTSMTLTGYFLGRAVPDLDQHLHLVVATVIFLSLLPGIVAWLRERYRTA